MNALSSFSSLFAGDSGVVLWAMFGGCIVAVGLAMEEIAELLNDRFLGEYKAHKTLRLLGWWTLMFGIWIEIADAGWTAYAIDRAKPENQPISQITASLILNLNVPHIGNDPDEGYQVIEGLLEGPPGRDWVGQLEADGKFNLFSESIVILERPGTRWGEFGTHEKILMRFGPKLSEGMGKFEATPVKIIGSIKHVSIQVIFRGPMDATLESGTLSIMANTTPPKNFEIPRQEFNNFIEIDVTNNPPAIR